MWWFCLTAFYSVHYISGRHEAVNELTVVILGTVVSPAGQRSHAGIMRHLSPAPCDCGSGSGSFRL